MSDFDFVDFNLTPGATDFPEEFLRRAFAVAVTPFAEEHSGIVFDDARNAINTLLIGLVEQSGDVFEIGFNAGIPDVSTANIYALFLLHWKCDDFGCTACAAPSVIASRVKFHGDFNRETAIADLNAAISFAYDGMDDVLDSTNPAGGANPAGILGIPPSGPDFGSSKDGMMSSLIDLALPGAALYNATAAAIVAVAEESGNSLDAVIARMEADTGITVPAEVHTALRDETYPGGANSNISAEEFYGVTEKLFGLQPPGAPSADFRLSEAPDGTFSFEN